MIRKREDREVIEYNQRKKKRGELLKILDNRNL